MELSNILDRVESMNDHFINESEKKLKEMDINDKDYPKIQKVFNDAIRFKIGILSLREMMFKKGSNEEMLNEFFNIFEVKFEDKNMVDALNSLLLVLC